MPASAGERARCTMNRDIVPGPGKSVTHIGRTCAGAGTKSSHCLHEGHIGGNKHDTYLPHPKTMRTLSASRRRCRPAVGQNYGG